MGSASSGREMSWPNSEAPRKIRNIRAPRVFLIQNLWFPFFASDFPLYFHNYSHVFHVSTFTSCWFLLHSSFADQNIQNIPQLIAPSFLGPLPLSILSLLEFRRCHPRRQVGPGWSWVWDPWRWQREWTDSPPWLIGSGIGSYTTYIIL